MSSEAQKTPKTETELRMEYNEYLLEAAADGDDSPMTWARFRSTIGGVAVNPSATLTPKTASDKPTSKASIARQVFIEGRQQNKSRKEILADFQTIALLTPSGSNTYYANFTAAVKEGKLVIPVLADAIIEDVVLPVVEDIQLEVAV